MQLDCTSYELLPETKQIEASTFYGYLTFSWEIYQLTDTIRGGWLGSYIIARSGEVIHEVDEDGERTYTVRVFCEGEEVFSQVMNNEEYFLSHCKRETFMRYGTFDAICESCARYILYGIHGRTSTIREGDRVVDEFMLSYEFDNMVMIDGLSCYRFRVSWYVTDSHWVFVGNLYVTPDGTIITAEQYAGR